MRARGFNATSVDDICSATGVTKGGFFHYFKSKEEVAKAAAVEFAESRANIFQTAPFNKLADPLDRVFGRLDFAIESIAAGRVTKGCLIGTLAQELSFTNDKLRAVCQESFERMAEDFERDLAAAKALHSPKSPIDPKALASLYISIYQGSLVIAKAAQKNEVIIRNLEQLRRYVEFLFGRGTSTSKKASKQAVRA